MESFDKNKKTVTDEKTIELLNRLITLRKKARESNTNLEELIKKTEAFLHPDQKK